MMNFFLLMLTWLICYLVTREKKTTNWSSYKPTSEEDILRCLINRDKYDEDTLRLIGNEEKADRLREEWMKNEEKLEALKKAKQEEWEKTCAYPTPTEKLFFHFCQSLIVVGIIVFIIYAVAKVLPRLIQ